jgi:hypothetical protein
VEFELFPKTKSGSSRDAQSPDEISSRIERRLNDDPTLRILVLLDEADQFLECEKRSNFDELSRMRTLMEKTDYRFKVVFCGLKDVQRYYTEVNHPFAQLSKPVEVGALEPQAAIALIKGPMRAWASSSKAKMSSPGYSHTPITIPPSYSCSAPNW